MAVNPLPFHDPLHLPPHPQPSCLSSPLDSLSISLSLCPGQGPHPPPDLRGEESALLTAEERTGNKRIVLCPCVVANKMLFSCVVANELRLKPSLNQEDTVQPMRCCSYSVSQPIRCCSSSVAQPMSSLLRWFRPRLVPLDHRDVVRA